MGLNATSPNAFMVFTRITLYFTIQNGVVIPKLKIWIFTVLKTVCLIHSVWAIFLAICTFTYLEKSQDEAVVSHKLSSIILSWERISTADFEFTLQIQLTYSFYKSQMKLKYCTDYLWKIIWQIVCKTIHR